MPNMSDLENTTLDWECTSYMTDAKDTIISNTQNPYHSCLSLSVIIVAPA